MIRPEFCAVALGLLLSLYAALYPTLAGAAGDLDTVERALDDEKRNEQNLGAAAGDIDRELAALKRQLVEAARRSQDLEERLTGIESTLLEMTSLEAELSGEIRQSKAAQAATLGALMRISRQPPQALIATPATIDDAIRASLLLRTTASLLDEQASLLGADLADLNALHRRIASQRMELDGAATGLADERRRLAALHDSAQVRRRQAGEVQALAAQRVARLAAEADSLHALFSTLALQAPAPPTKKPTDQLPADETPTASSPAGDLSAAPPNRLFSAARGSLALPARGRLIGLFGQGEGGRLNKGLSIETRDGAQVVTPYDGEVVYAGQFLGYGRLLIIDHGEGYHTLLAGFSRIDSIQGQWLLAGEPVGVMGVGLTGYKVLYVELRHDGVAINPLPWLAASEKKADG